MTANTKPMYVLLGVNLALVAVTLFLPLQLSASLGQVRSDVRDLWNAAPADYSKQLDQLVREVDTICNNMTENQYVACY